MLTDGTSTSVAAGATVNVFLGRPVEFLGVPTMMRLLMASDPVLAGLNLTAQLLINVGAAQSVPLAAGAPINANAAGVFGLGPKDDEDTLIPQVAIPAGARLQLNVTNPGAGAVAVRYRAIIAS